MIFFLRHAEYQIAWLSVNTSDLFNIFLIFTHNKPSRQLDERSLDLLRFAKIFDTVIIVTSFEKTLKI